MNKVEETIASINDYMDELGIAQREHEAYKECYQFDGDECGACDDFERAFEEAHAVRDDAFAAAFEAHDEEQRFAWVLARDLPVERTPDYIARFNTRYVTIVRRFGRDLNEYLLRLALEEAGSSLADEMRPRERITITDADRIECAKCLGTGVFSLKTARTNEDGSTERAVCFACHGKGWLDRADQWRNNTYWAKYARV